MSDGAMRVEANIFAIGTGRGQPVQEKSGGGSARHRACNRARWHGRDRPIRGQRPRAAAH